MRWRIPLVVALALFVVVSCDQKLVEPTADPVVEAPAFNFSNNPDNGNARIFRFQGDVFFLLFEYPDGPAPPGDPDLVAVHSTTPDCGGISALADLQQVVDDPDNPMDGKIRELTLADPINIFIVDLTQAGNCFGFQLVARGTGKLVNTDSDVFVWNRPSNNANVFGFTAQATLYGPGGEKAHYNGVSKITWDGDTGDRFFVNEKFNFRWTGS